MLKGELEHGTDPDDPDTDDDGLTDAEEVKDHGTDPLRVDTDRDGYDDWIEVQASTDPLAAWDRPYVGGWPFNPDKDALGALDDWSGDNEVGARLPRMRMRDQHREYVDAYDFAAQGVDTVVLFCGIGFDACHGLGALLAGQPSAYDGDAELEALRDAVQDGRLQWITVLDDDAQYEGPTQQDQAWWDSAYPNPDRLLLADRRGELHDWWGYIAELGVLVVDAEMVIQVGGTDWRQNLSDAASRLPEGSR